MSRVLRWTTRHTLGLGGKLVRCKYCYLCIYVLVHSEKNKRLLKFGVECALFCKNHICAEKVMLLFSLDVSVGRRGELLYLGVKFLIGPVFCDVVQVAVKIHQ